ncbi:MAG: hypothetical protein P0Y58_05000 [Candidatus Pseudomonas phytovorans]|uniref:Uncharacterized protein n=1 Tax=Candidatus Pseudomonas phytovorans TaxID=3121377 RepID=A0AAJ5WKZ0_9PSED|nr:hypothetical protein [Pseudomonas sp.]WEK31558.1 MAG: hypothetical protein P0Y58_05000 [Pseudomonas sp.]
MARNRVPLSTRPVDEASGATMPSSVVKAMQVPFDLEVTAYLSSVQYGPGELYLQGVIFNDREQRFEDGASIRTSIIMAAQEIHGFFVVRTLSSLYVVCDWAGDAAREISKAKH